MNRPAAILFVDDPMTREAHNHSYAADLDCVNLLLLDEKSAGATVPGIYAQRYHAPFMDRQALLELGGRIADKFHVIAVLGFTELSVYPAALLAENLGVAGIGCEAALACRDKSIMARKLAGAGVAQPTTQVVDAVDPEPGVAVERLGGFPVVCKPLMGVASCGVMLASDDNELQKSLRQIRRLNKLLMPGFYDDAGKQEKVLLQSYLPGEEIAVDGYVQAGKVSIIAIIDKPDVAQGPCFPDHFYLLPSQVDGRMQARIERVTRQAVTALGLDNTVFHLEARFHEGEPHVLEVAVRIGCGELIKNAFGIDMCAIELALRLGREVNAEPQFERFAGEACITAERRGVFHGIRNLKQLLKIPYVSEVPLYARPGQQVAPLPMVNSYIAFIMVEADTYADARESLKRAAGVIQVDIG